jgi:uncharacterized SAM-binding protein YcdF (DUF218 family)
VWWLGSLVVALVWARWCAATWSIVDRRGRGGRIAAGTACAAAAVWLAPRGLVLGKLVGALAMPMGALWLLLAAAAARAYWRRSRRELAILGAALAGLSLVGNDYLADRVMAWVEDGARTISTFDTEPVDAAIVLGGGTRDQAAHAVGLGDSGDRVMTGARLYYRGIAPVLVCSGSPIAGFDGHDSAAATERIWRELGVPASAIVRVDGARNTREEARLHAALIHERGWRRIGLVTSGYHMRRALALFRAEGIDAVPLPADLRGRESPWLGAVSIVPTGAAAGRLHKACWELVGRLAGR